MNFSRTSGFGFRNASQQQQQNQDNQQQQSNPNPNNIVHVDPQKLTEKRKQVIFRTVKTCSGLYKAAKSSCMTELQENLLPTLLNSQKYNALDSSSRFQVLRRTILLSWYCFAKCGLKVESYSNIIPGLDQLFKLLLQQDIQKAPFESFFVMPFLKDMQQQQKNKEKLPACLANFQKRVVMRLHHLCVACISQSVRIGSQLAFVEHAANVLHLMMVMVSSSSSETNNNSATNTNTNMTTNLEASSLIKCMTVPSNLNPAVAGAMTKIVGLAKTALGESLVKELLEYPLNRVCMELNGNTNNQQQQQNNFSNNSNTKTTRNLFVISDLLDSLWSKGDTSAMLKFTAVTRTYLLKYFSLLCVQYLKIAENTNNNNTIVNNNNNNVSPLNKVRKFLLWAVLRLPWHSIDKRIRSVFADWDPAIQNVMFDVCTQIFTSSMLSPPSNAFSATFEKVFSTSATKRTTFHKWLPDVPVAAFASMTNCVCNVFFFSTSCMLMGNHNPNSGKWQSLLGEMCLSLHPFKTYPPTTNNNNNNKNNNSNNNLNAFDGIFEVLDGSSSSKISTAVASPTITAHWYNAVARLWNREILMKVFGIFSGTTTTTTNNASSPNNNNSVDSPNTKKEKESFGDAIRRAFADAIGERGSGGIRPVWFPENKTDGASSSSSTSSAYSELTLPAFHLSWFGFCSFLNAIVSRGRIVSILNTLVQLQFFISALWKRIGDMNGGRRWIEKAVYYTSAEGIQSVRQQFSTSSNSSSGKNSSSSSPQIQAQMIKEMEIACDFVSCVSLLFATLSHAFLVGSDDDVKKGWPLPFTTLDSITGFANTLVLLITALNDSGNTLLRSGSLPPVKQISSLQEQLLLCKVNLRRFLRLLEDRDVRMSLVPDKRRKECFWGLDKDSLKWANSLVGPASESPSSRDRDGEPLGTIRNGPLSSLWLKVLSSSSGDAQQDTSVVQNLSNYKTFSENASIFSLAICREMPHAVPFDIRVAALRAAFHQQKIGRRFFLGQRFFNVRRDQVILDGYRLFVGHIGYNEPTQQLRSHLQIQLLDEHGRMEAGIDGGGVFKEFLEILLKEITNPQLGLFALTADNSQCYPNPSVETIFAASGGNESIIPGVQAPDMFRFLGRVLGKAIFEGVVVTLPLAGFFLNNVLGRPNVLEDLVTLDPQLFRSLNQLKEMEDVSLAGLYFADEENVCGQVRSIPLIPGGEDVEVTNDNVVRYLHLLAHFRLVKSIQPLTDAFVTGLTEVIDRRHIAMFNGKELRQLISGKDGGDFNVDELMEHTKYAGGYTPMSSPVRWLWEILKEDCDKNDRAAFLQFCTGSSRPPLLGFASMEPPFAIQKWKPSNNNEEDQQQQQRQQERGFFDRVFGNDDVKHLPMAATCFNLLKLPEYTSKANMKDRILTAIRSKAGFEYA